MTSNKILPFYFKNDDLNKLLETHQLEFNNSEPFRHVVIDNFVPDDVLDMIIDEFPGPGDIDWNMWGPGNIKHSGNKEIEKIGSSNDEKFGAFTRHFMSQLNSNSMVKFIEGLTKTKDILVDPTYNGCGLHSTGPGGKLMVHIDTNRHPITDRDLIHQRYNLILFLNKDWKDEYGGHLELWNKDATACVKKIAPIFNRAVIFDTGSYSYHGHPEPLTCPVDRRRNSIAVYYYILNRKPDIGYSGMRRTVKWVATNEADKALTALDWGNVVKTIFFNIFFKVTPPFIIDIIKYFRHRKHND